MDFRWGEGRCGQNDYVLLRGGAGGLVVELRYCAGLLTCGTAVGLGFLILVLPATTAAVLAVLMYRPNFIPFARLSVALVFVNTTWWVDGRESSAYRGCTCCPSVGAFQEQQPLFPHTA